MALRSELVQSYLRVVTKPGEFFDETPSPTAVEGGLAVFVVGVAMALSILGMGAVMSGTLRSQGYPEGAAAVWGFIAQYMVISVLGVFLIWIVSGAVMHVIATAADGGDSFGATLAVTGYGMLPTVLNVVVGFGFVTLALQSVTLSGGPQAVAGQIQSVLQQGTLPRDLANWGFLAWQAIIWTRGLERVHDVTLGNAALAALVVAVASGLLG
jgi:hypothetical protein